MVSSIFSALMGGAIIGLAASLMLIFNGRVTGISGIANGFLTSSESRSWRGAFLLGLVLGGFILSLFHPEFFTSTTPRSIALLMGAGLLVGFGTVMGGGCTSGHGVCGISRFSMRSLLATLLFMTVGMIIATTFKYLTAVN